MLIKEEITNVNGHPYTRIAAIRCDMCGEADKGARITDDGTVTWQKGIHDWVRTSLTLWEGYGSPEGVDLDIKEFHICVDCFKARILPWLQEQGVEPSRRSIEC